MRLRYFAPNRRRYIAVVGVLCNHNALHCFDMVNLAVSPDAWEAAALLSLPMTLIEHPTLLRMPRRHAHRKFVARCRQRYARLSTESVQ